MLSSAERFLDGSVLLLRLAVGADVGRGQLLGLVDDKADTSCVLGAALCSNRACCAMFRDLLLRF